MNSKTVNEILVSLDKVKNEIQSEFAKKIEASKSMWEAYQTYNNLHNTLGFRGLKATYQGTPITSNCILPKKGLLKKYNKRFGNSRSNWEKEISIVPKTNAIIFHHDKTIAMNSVYKRILQYLDTTNDELRSELYLLSFHDSGLMNEWLNDARFDGACKVNLANVPYVNPKKASVHKVVKSTAYLYTGAGYRNYSKWRDITIDLNGTGVYLPIKRNMCEDISFEALDRLIENMVRIDNRIDIIGVRADEVKTLGSGWINYFDYCHQKGLEYINKHDLQDSINKYFAYNGIPNNWELIKRKHIYFGGIDLDLFFSHLKSTPYSVSNLLWIQREIHKNIVNLTDSKYVDEYNAIKDKYDLIPAFDMSQFSILTDEMLIKYVNMVN
jgi:hypothetical protein